MQQFPTLSSELSEISIETGKEYETVQDTHVDKYANSLLGNYLRKQVILCAKM